MGKEYRRRVKKWIEKGNPNLGHIDSLIEAEYAALNGKRFVARQKHELVILIAARSGLMMDAGLASECFGEHNLEVGEIEDAVFRFKEAIKYVREVGSDGKTSQLAEKHAKLWPPPAEVVAAIPYVLLLVHIATLEWGGLKSILQIKQSLQQLLFLANQLFSP